MINSVSIIGLGKLGLVMAALFADKFHKVIGIDINKDFVDKINRGECPIYEPGMPELLQKAHSKLLATTDDYESAILSTDATFIIVPTPSDESGAFINDYILDTIRCMSPHLKKKRGYHLVTLTSTVMPGSMANVLAPALENLSGKKVGEDIGFCYSPEFIALGNVIYGMSKPDAVLIGESDNYAGDMLEGIYKIQCDSDPPIHRMSWWNAEVAKISLNVFMTAKMSLANTFAEVCERIPGGDSDAITNFLGCDTRIGRKYLKGAVGYGGPCFPRDNRAFAKFASTIGAQCQIQRDVDDFNNNHDRLIVERVIGVLGTRLSSRTVAILGLAYKPDVDMCEDSASIRIAEGFRKAGVWVKCYDPAAMADANRYLGNHRITYANSIDECLKGSDFCVITTPWPEFALLTVEQLKKTMNKPRVLDGWRQLDGEKLKKAGIEYYAIGVA